MRKEPARRSSPLSARSELPVVKSMLLLTVPNPARCAFSARSAPLPLTVPPSRRFGSRPVPPRSSRRSAPVVRLRVPERLARESQRVLPLTCTAPLSSTGAPVREAAYTLLPVVWFSVPAMVHDAGPFTFSRAGDAPIFSVASNLLSLRSSWLELMVSAEFTYTCFAPPGPSKSRMLQLIVTG